jgi:hypothetical protein
MSSELREDSTKQLHKLLAAVAERDASPSEIAEALRAIGIDSVEDFVVALAEFSEELKTTGATVPLSLASREVQDSTGSPGFNIHRSKVPVLLNGTLYDPDDTVRFNGKELHFAPSADGRYLLAVDDRKIMQDWWRLAKLAALTQSDGVERYRYGGFEFGAEPQFVSPIPPEPVPPPQPPPLPSTGGGTAYKTFFYTDARSRGSSLALDKDRGYWDLTNVSGGGGFLNLDSWNDKISSFQMFGTHWTVLHERVHWTGSTFTSRWGIDTLVDYGWNDRASSLETW